MSKKIIILLIILVSTSLFSVDSAKLNIKINKIMKKFKSNKVDLIVVGEVISLSSKLKKGMTIPVTKVKFRVINAYKSSIVKAEITVRIKGGRYIANNGKEYVKFSKKEAYPLLDSGDIILMGLKKLNNGDYKHVFRNKLQIPFSNELIEQINDDTKEHKLRKLYLKTSISSNRISNKENKIIERFDSKKENEKYIINKLKKKINNNFEESEVEVE